MLCSECLFYSTNLHMKYETSYLYNIRRWLLLEGEKAGRGLQYWKAHSFESKLTKILTQRRVCKRLQGIRSGQSDYCERISSDSQKLKLNQDEKPMTVWVVTWKDDTAVVNWMFEKLQKVQKNCQCLRNRWKMALKAFVSREVYWYLLVT